MTEPRSLSAAESRRLALHAQGFGEKRDTAKRTNAVLALVNRLGVLQIDSVNVVVRAHYLPVFARLGSYDRAALDAMAWSRPSRLFEYWGHQASLVPVSSQPLFRWRMDRARAGQGTYAGLARFGREKKPFIAEILAQIRDRGPLAASELRQEKGKSGWWEWSPAKRALEWLFWSGQVAASTRRSFERLYDLSERVLPPEIMAAPTPSLEEAHRELLRISTRALGVATEDDLADYFRLARRDVRPRLAELVEEGALVRASVEGWDKPAFVDAAAKTPRAIEGCAVLAPFDPVVWYRPRAERMFDFHYRISIYTPADARVHGYYVMPILLGDRLVGRVDLKAARKVASKAGRSREPGGSLLVHAAHLEEGASPADVAAGLGPELGRLARWLGLDDVVVARKGKLSAALRVVVRRGD